LRSRPAETERLPLLREALASVTHDVRNILTLGLARIELARHKSQNRAPELVSHLDRIEYSCRTALRILDDALGRVSPREEAVLVSIPELAQRIIDLKRLDLRRDGITVRLEFPPEFPLVIGGEVPLQQVLLNLVTNAREALRDARGERAIRVVGLDKPGRAVVDVRDTGPGIPPHVLPLMFEPFYTTKPEGTGLGLAICAGIARRLGGELTAFNAPAGGAVLRLSLPAISPSALLAPSGLAGRSREADAGAQS
jgi:signal transduction histidine kinase